MQHPTVSQMCDVVISKRHIVLSTSLSHTSCRVRIGLSGERRLRGGLTWNWGIVWGSKRRLLHRYGNIHSMSPTHPTECLCPLLIGPSASSTHQKREWRVYTCELSVVDIREQLPAFTIITSSIQTNAMLSLFYIVHLKCVVGSWQKLTW